MTLRAIAGTTLICLAFLPSMPVIPGGIILIIGCGLVINAVAEDL